MHTQGWLQGLTEHASRLVDEPLRETIAREPDRVVRDTIAAGPLTLCLARQRLDAAAWDALYRLALRTESQAALRHMLDGAEVNRSEGRPALHTALRTDLGRGAAAVNGFRQAGEARREMARLAERLWAEGVTDLVNIGIGGSDFGPRLAIDALAAGQAAKLRIHFLSAPDGHTVEALCRQLDPNSTALLLVSKSFSTEETLLNGRVMVDWLSGRGPVLAATSKVDKAAEYGVQPDAILPMWDWVGGRYSLWSAVGFSIMAAYGVEVFQRLLQGAATLDRHALEVEPALNLPLRHALVQVWNRNALGYDSLAVLPYDQRLRLLPTYLQQLIMESLGKSVSADGSRLLDVSTAPVIWGGPGTDCQHSYFQALHQGTDTVPTEFIGVCQPAHGHRAMHQSLWANLLAQSEALANGVANDDKHRRYVGNRPSSVLMLDELSPEALGSLIAFYEHSVFLQSVLWGINAFDQWGVELGKVTAKRIAPAVADPTVSADDPVTASLLGHLHRKNTE
ncbi:glucose-6-phosphate isomerase [Pseudomarimonas arenosa]|uniref:Glucose-6-phosphate isomerase n=1 Tax=Pseudomarimonas arenosa TaxID=2774145 RepID=A0AAW3ZL19_9GAMM|nr:glucose-6-phosphate isomerase [Pseudomarimonas arenosa]MBD8526800.1 glucose-6-phosphate isomerase [Pseudomarimonas arenosa]